MSPEATTSTQTSPPQQQSVGIETYEEFQPVEEPDGDEVSVDEVEEEPEVYDWSDAEEEPVVEVERIVCDILHASPAKKECIER